VEAFRINLTKAQLQSFQWILLGAMPGTILALGGLVWLRRRK
jgi:LPXTG-motif cell wall-anchored protein